MAEKFYINPFAIFIDFFYVKCWSKSKRLWMNYQLPKIYTKKFVKEYREVSFSKELFFKHLSRGLDQSTKELFFKSLINKEIIVRSKNIKKYQYNIAHKRIIQAHDTCEKHPHMFFRAAASLGYAVKYRTPYSIDIQCKLRRHIAELSYFPSLLNREAMDLVQDKFKCNTILRSSGLPILNSVVMKAKNIILNAEKFTYPLVLKPVEGRGGWLVFCNIKSPKELRLIVEKYILPKKDRSTKKFILEKFFIGETLRILASTKSIYSSILIPKTTITGDGKTKIEELIKTKIPSLSDGIPVALRHLVESKKLKLTDTLLQGQRLMISEASNYYSKVANMDFLSKKSLSKTIGKALKLVGLSYAVVDVIIKRNKKRNKIKEFYVLDINPCPEFSFHSLAYKNQGTFESKCLKPLVKWVMESRETKVSSGNLKSLL